MAGVAWGLGEGCRCVAVGAGSEGPDRHEGGPLLRQLHKVPNHGGQTMRVHSHVISRPAWDPSPDELVAPAPSTHPTHPIHT